jgi:hypothetical protein
MARALTRWRVRFAAPAWRTGARRGYAMAQAGQPLTCPSSATGKIHVAAALLKLQRLIMPSSTHSPAEWLRVTVDMHSAQLFSRNSRR